MVDLDTKKVEDPEYIPNEEYRPSVGACVVLLFIAVVTVITLIITWYAMH